MSGKKINANAEKNDVSENPTLREKNEVKTTKKGKAIVRNKG